MTTDERRPSKPRKQRPAIPTITDERLAVLMAAAELIEADVLFRAPTIRNLARAIGRAKSTIHGHLLGLREQQCIDGNPYTARGYWLTEMGAAIVDAAIDRGVPSPVKPGFVPRTRSEQTPNR